MNDSPLNSTDNPLGWLANSTTIWDPYEPTYSGADAYGAASVVVIVLDILLMIANVDRIILIRNTKVRMALFTFYALDVTQQLFAAIVYNQVLYASDAFRMGFASYVCYCLYAAEETVLSYMIYQTIASPIETMYPRLRWIPYILMGIEFCLGQIYAFIMAPNAYAYESSDLAVAALPIIQPLWSCWHLLFEIVVFGMLTKHMLAIKEAVVTSETENKGGGGNAKARPNKTFGFYLMVSMMMRLAICIGSEGTTIYYGIQLALGNPEIPFTLMAIAGVLWSLRPMIIVTDVARAVAFSRITDSNASEAPSRIRATRLASSGSEGTAGSSGEVKRPVGVIEEC